MIPYKRGVTRFEGIRTGIYGNLIGCGIAVSETLMTLLGGQRPVVGTPRLERYRCLITFVAVGLNMYYGAEHLHPQVYFQVITLDIDTSVVEIQFLLEMRVEGFPFEMDTYTPQLEHGVVLIERTALTEV